MQWKNYNTIYSTSSKSRLIFFWFYDFSFKIRIFLHVAGYFLGVDPPPAYFDYLTFNLDLKNGINFASGAGGILDESGYNYVCWF
jgi:hypothetical protein